MRIKMKCYKLMNNICIQSETDNIQIIIMVNCKLMNIMNIS